ncbi:hypothetical protein [Aulosira sp. FACHB-615]|uniref:hypothetical protein n=1 Tax=Aulosira sp. FACHB-615 TaxID=2692777 RepID=UPI0016898AE7|nr:hypothetical protein [Aulosira sp. FACHB-615]MBD2488230.1 hypothetical protein [Aulosira sp. FACHB-615]
MTDLSPVNNNEPPNQPSASDPQEITTNLPTAPTFNTWPELLSFILKTKHGLLFVSILILVAGVFTSLSIYIMRPDQIEITTTAGTINLKKGNQQDAILLLNPVGDAQESPWVKTGIQVKKGDKVTITASGRVNNSLKRLIWAAQTDEELESLWVDPEGSKPKNDYLKDRNKYKVLPDKNGAYYGYGMLIAAIKDSKEQIDPNNIEPIGKNKTFTATTNGELLLTVNDIWLSSEMKEVYAPPFNDDHLEYYLTLAKLQAGSNQDFDSWSKTIQRQKAQEQYPKRLKQWQKIVKEKNWNVWYNDNTGSFSVSISINK